MDLENKNHIEENPNIPHSRRKRSRIMRRRRISDEENREDLIYRNQRLRDTDIYHRGTKIHTRSIILKRTVLLGLFLLVIAIVFVLGFLMYRGISSRNAQTSSLSDQAISESLSVDEYGNPIYSDEEINDRNDLSSEQKRLLGIRNSLESGNSVLETLRRFFPETLVVSHGDRYIFKDIDNSLKMNDYESSEVTVLPTGEYIYARDGELISHKGIDVSSHQGEIDWEKVGNTDIEFVFMRALYRGYESGKLVEDDMFKINLEGAAAQGIKTGVYIFTQAVTEKEVDQELEMLDSLLGGASLDLPVVVDVEEAGDGTGRMDQLTIAERTEIIKYYCESIKERGYTPMIYFSITGAVLMLNLEELEDYDKWFAVYDTEFYYPYAYSIWQYSDSGSVDGIEGNVDLDLSFMNPE